MYSGNFTSCGESVVDFLRRTLAYACRATRRMQMAANQSESDDEAHDREKSRLFFLVWRRR